MRSLIILFSVTLISCAPHKIIEPKPGVIEEQEKTCEGAQMAIIKPLLLDGCTWVLELPSEEKLEPINYSEYLTENELKQQLPFKVKVVFRDTKSASICMVGRTVSITCLERLK